MFPQIAYLRTCIITLVAFVWFVSTVRLQMCPEMACPRRGTVTLVAFEWFFSVVHFQMTCQAAFHITYIFTYVALVCFFSFIICVSRGNIFICPIFTEVIICNILIHQNQVENVVRWNCQFQTEKIRRENKWKWELLLKTPDQTRTDNRDNDRRQRQQYKDKKSNDTKFDDKNTKAKKYSGQIKWQQNTTTTYINKNKNKDFPQDILYI